MYLLIIFSVVVVLSVIIAVKYTKCHHRKLELLAELTLAKKFDETLPFSQTLDQLYNFNKKLINAFYTRCNKAPMLCPNKYGVFRTESLSDLSPDDIFLGDISGLWTNTLTEWMKSNEPEDLRIIQNQYYNILNRGIYYIIEDIKKDINNNKLLKWIKI